MSMELDVSGFEALEKALLQLPRAVARRTVQRALRKELKPVASAANAFWPGADNDVFRVSARLPRRHRSDSLADFSKTVVNMFVGSSKTPHAHLLEFGTGPRRQTTTGRYTGHVSPLPMLQPAWDARKPDMLKSLGETIWQEIAKSTAKLEANG